MSNRVLVLGFLGYGTGRHKPFDQVYQEGEMVDAKAIDDGANIDALIIWGGEDISPSLYHDAVADMCGAGAQPSRRDRAEVDACKAAIERGIPIIGVCRGAQLVCAMAGGRLIQHVDNHAGRNHPIETFDGQVLECCSVHHQMMFPFDVPDHKLIAWSKHKLSRRYIVGTNESDPRMLEEKEPEIVWFPNIKALAIQSHPEFHRPTDPFVPYCMDLVRQFILNEEMEIQ